MPRRNRNAHALTIDADKLADQASQLTTELGCPNGVTVCLVADETQPCDAASAQGTGKSPVLRTYLAEWISHHPGHQAHVADATAVTPDAR
jgi:hypothetical protein